MPPLNTPNIRPIISNDNAPATRQRPGAGRHHLGGIDMNHATTRLPAAIAAATIVLVGVIHVGFGAGLGLLGVGLLVAFLVSARQPSTST